MTVEWTFGDPSPENLQNLAQISQWLETLRGKMVIQRKRVSQFGSVINWGSTPGDGYLHLGPVQIRGTTIYYMDLEEMRELGVLASRIELDQEAGTVTIHSGRVNGGVVRLELTQKQRTIALGNASYALEGDTLVVEDRMRHLTVRMPFSPEVARLLLPYFADRGVLDRAGFRPGETCPQSGQWEIMEPYWVPTGEERTVVKGEPFPPLRFDGGGFQLVDSTRHHKAR